MRILHIFQYWTDPTLWFTPHFWYYNETTPKGFRLLTVCGITIVFDRPEKYI